MPSASFNSQPSSRVPETAPKGPSRTSCSLCRREDFILNKKLTTYLKEWLVESAMLFKPIYRGSHMDEVVLRAGRRLSNVR